MFSKIQLFISLSLLCFAAAMSFNDCGSGAGDIEVHVNMCEEGEAGDVCHLTRGHTVAANITFTAPHDISSLEIKARANIFHEWVEFDGLFNDDACSYLAEHHTHCPIAKGQVVSYAAQAQLPDFVPPVFFVGEVRLLDQNQEDILCMTKKFKIIKD